MGRAMVGVTRSLAVMNRQMNLPAMQRMMMEFEKQNEMMDFKSEMMDDVMDDVFSADQEEERTEEMVGQILDEVGIGATAGLVNTPMGGAAKAQAVEDPGEKDLQARLESLRGPK